MKDNDLFTNIKAVIDAGLAANSVAGVQVIQNYQPTQEGVPDGPIVTMNKEPGDERYGSPQHVDKWDPTANDGDGAMVHTETQILLSTFQVNALLPQAPNPSLNMTASDMLNLVAAILNSDAAIVTFQGLGLGVLRVTKVRNVPFVDDKGRNEFSPSFDFTLSHSQVIISTSPVVAQFTDGLYRI